MTLPRENPSPGDYPDVYALTCEMGVTVKGQSDDDLYFNENKSFFQEVCSPCTKDIRSKQSTPFPTFPVRRYCLADTRQAPLIIEALLRINVPVCDPSSAITASPADKSPSTTGREAAAELHHGAKPSSDAIGLSDDTEPVATAGPEHDAGLSSAGGPPSAPEPRDDPPVPAELHLKAPAARLTDVADPLSSGELSSVFGPSVENVPRVCPGTDSYADSLKINKGDELTVHRPNRFLEVPVDASWFQYR
ncbi:hypothetical protein J6590_093532 [Homalodisca vitripennis]|nr:hypothetical protein J6590_093532 [Homalodisca vitripennis]